MNNFANIYSSNSLAAVLDAVGELLTYAREKAFYEADCHLRGKAAEIRSALFAGESARSLFVTKELARCKIKLKLLQKEMEKETSPVIKNIFQPLLDDLRVRIVDLRITRSRSYL